MHIVFAKGGVEGSCVESFGNFSRKKSFRCHFFRNLVSGKLFLLYAVFNRNFSCKSPHIAKPFSVVRHYSDTLCKEY